MGTMKALGVVFIILGVLIGGLQITLSVIADYEYNRDVMYNWHLADKTSTLEAKADYIDKFVQIMDKTKFAEYDALWLKTQDNNVQNNINAVKSLKDRLNEIKGLDPESFAYQTAIQQITAQEQGEATEMLSVIKGGWYLEHHFLLWSWVVYLFATLGYILILGGIILIMKREYG